MDKKIKILLLVAEPWRSDDSGGNTMENFFHGMKDVEFAHVYCADALPDNEVCSKYFQISENEVIRNFLLHNKVGHNLAWPIQKQKSSSDSIAQSVSRKGKIKSWIRIIKGLRPEFLITLRMLIWRYSNWKTQALDTFITEFAPDVIYAPCYAFPFQLALTRHVKELTGKKIVTWSADDNYSLRQFNLSPFFWLNRFWVRHCLRKTYPYYDEFFSISEDEIEEMTPVVGKQMKILRKGVRVPEIFTQRNVHQPIQFIYAGGLYLNRHKILISIADALRKINKETVKAELHIYSGSNIDEKSKSLLNDGASSFMHGLVSPAELAELYQRSDVAIHCESFELKYRLTTRLSFSTKIIDCFQSGCAILAIAWSEHTGLKYLKKEDAAICVTDIKNISTVIGRLVDHPEIIKEYAQKAYDCEKRNHRIEDVQKTLYDSLVRCSS